MTGKRKSAPDTDDTDAPESAPTELDEDGEEVCSVCGRKGRPPGHH